jgi:hypothetical protein
MFAGCSVAASAHGQYLVYAVEFNQSNNRFGTLNLLNGSFAQISSLGSTLINDIAYRFQDGKLFGIRNNGASLVTFNTTNGAMTTVASLSVSGIQSIAFRPSDGVLFGATQSKLYRINTTNGVATLVGNFGSAPYLGTSGQNIRFAQDGNLYVSNTSSNTSIYRINTTNGSALWVGEVTGYPNLILENGGQYIYGVSIAVGAPGGTAPQLLGFDLSEFVAGGTNADGSTHQIAVAQVGACTNFPVNFNFSGDVPQQVVDPTVPVSATGPVSLTNFVSTTAVFSTVASGTPPYGYVWLKNGAAISGQTNSSLTLSNVSAGDAATYSVIVTGAMGSVTNSATLTVIPLLSPPVATAASSVSTNGFTANWNASTNATTYYLDVSTDGGFGTFVGGYSNLDVGNITSSSVTGLAANTTYYYRVRAGNAGGSSANSGTVSVMTLVATLAAVSSSANPCPTGSNVTFTASIAAAGSGVPTGTVQFLAGGASLGSAALVDGLATLTTSALPHGTHTITAQYAGDGNFLGSTNSLSPDQVINARPVAAGDDLQYCENTGAKLRIATLLANDTDPEDDVLTFCSVSPTSAAGGAVVATNKWVFYTPPSGFTNSDTLSYVVADSFGLQATGSVSVTIVADSGLSQNVAAIEDLGNDTARVRFQGIPGRAYTVQYTESLLAPDWRPLGTRTADATGRFEFTDTLPYGSPPRFYRSTYP